MRIFKFLMLLVMAGFVGGLLALIFNPLTFEGNTTHSAGFIANATAEAENMGFYGNFQLAVWKFWPLMIMGAIVIVAIMALRKKNEE